ncbi:MAG: ABC transporter ATP-binding protein [Candidatus Hydrogenedentales bacterium]
MTETLLETHEVRKHFNGTTAVDGVSLSIARGSIVSLIGPNGAGKTTLFNVVTGFLSPDSGRVSFEGRDVTRMAAFRRARLGMGRTFQEMRLILRLSALENVWLALPNQRGETVIGALLGLHKREEKQRRAEALGWLEYVGIPETANQLAGELSYGQQKLLSVACCLGLGAKLLLLDEPVAGVNPALVDRMLELLERLRREQGKTIVLIEHNMDAVMRISDRVIAMDEGRIIADGTPEQVRADAVVIEAYLS